MIWALGVGNTRAGQTDDKKEDKAAIKKNGENFVAAFEKGDTKAMAECFAPEGEWTDEVGDLRKGRETIEKAFAEFFAQNKGLKLRIDSKSLRFLTPDVAIEEGISAVIEPDGGPPSQARYANVHVKKDGQWLLGSSKTTPYAPVNNSSRLHELDWLLGDWAEEPADKEVARASFDWSDNQTFIISNFATTFKNIAMGGGTQWIGWDPVDKHIRSWTFYADGGYGQGSWATDGAHRGP
jgi:uncharacterized protein (TIGR02246 family)